MSALGGRGAPRFEEAPVLSEFPATRTSSKAVRVSSQIIPIVHLVGFGASGREQSHELSRTYERLGGGRKAGVPRPSAAVMLLASTDTVISRFR